MPKKARSTSKRNKKPKFRGIPSCKTTRNEVNELEHFSEDTEEIQVQVPEQQASLTGSTEESQPSSSRMEQQQSLDSCGFVQGESASARKLSKYSKASDCEESA